MKAESRTKAKGLTARGPATRDRIVRDYPDHCGRRPQGLSIDKVRLLAEVSRSQLSHYFDDKSALVRAALERPIELVMAIPPRTHGGGLDSWSPGRIGRRSTCAISASSVAGEDRRIIIWRANSRNLMTPSGR